MVPDTVSPGDWAADLMRKNASGSVWHVSLATGERRCLAKDLAFPYGLIVDAANNRVIVSEAWKHRLLSIPLQGGKPTVVLANLAGYPARMSATRSGGYVLSLFAPRNRLIEFVLLEDNYRNAMLEEIDSRYWIAPSLSASPDFLEPLQSGGVKTMGIHKPWSPSRSYGLVAVLDENFQPVTSYHSRANGTRHGITSAIEHKGNIIATSRGGNVILQVTPEKGADMSDLIVMQKVSKHYRGVPAVREVDFTLEKGEIHALLGENGAGKSTLTKIMAGVVEATSGTMLYRGKQVDLRFAV